MTSCRAGELQVKVDVQFKKEKRGFTFFGFNSTREAARQAAARDAVFFLQTTLDSEK